MTDWTPSSWRQRPVAQPVIYDDDQQSVLEKTRSKLAQLPPLVQAAEIENLKAHLKDVAEGRAFLLQGGDCAELFEYCTSKTVEDRLSLVLLMSLVLVWGSRKKVVRVIRGAGQYAKPRSSPKEIVHGQEVLSFRGDNINGFHPSERTPDPDRMLQAYFHSGITLNTMRSLLSSGFADLHNPRSWRLGHVRSPALHQAFETVVDRLEDALDFMRVVGADPTPSSSSSSSSNQAGLASTLQSVDVFVSHEALLLEYEEALVRRMKNPKSTDSMAHYATSGHFLWIGDRTRQLDGAHVEFFSGIANPIGIKCGPSLRADELVQLLHKLDPTHEPGRISLIARYGAAKVEACLPGHIEAVKKSGHPVIWVCDPMHGNTHTAAESGVKTRHISDIVLEVTKSIEIHAKHESRLGGIHLELTGDTDAQGFSVTECLGGSQELQDRDLSLRYQTYCDPRLNAEQSLDIAFLLAQFLAQERKRGRYGGNKDMSRDTAESILAGLSSRSASPAR